MRNLFCYGTLQLPEVMKNIIGRVPPSQSAVLPSFARYRVTGEYYPAVVTRKDASTSGVLYFRFSLFELRKLDRFEGLEYRRQVENIFLSDGGVIRACVYVWQDDRSRLSRQDWELPQFICSPAYAGFPVNRLSRSR